MADMEDFPLDHEPSEGSALALDVLNSIEPKSAYLDKKPRPFTENRARVFLEHIRLGLTIPEVCSKHGMPERLTLYDWLKDPSLKIGDKSFGACYDDAMQDRNLSWLDDSILGLKKLSLTGRKDDGAMLRKSDMIGNMRIKIETQSKNLTNTGVSSSGGTINVNIKTFETPKEIE